MSLSEDAVWFSGSGLAVITIGLFNYIVIRTQAKDRIINGLSYVINALGTITLLFVAIALDGEPQPIPLFLLLISACILILKMSKLSDQNIKEK